MTENLRLGDILSLATLKENLAQVITELTQTENYKKVVVLKDKPAVALVSAEEYRAVQQQLAEFGEYAKAFPDVRIDLFAVKDLLDEATLVEKLEEILEQVHVFRDMKVLLKNDEPAIILLPVSDYEHLEQKLFALTAQQTVKEMMEADARGELIDLDDLAAEFGVTLKGDHPKPEGYDEMIPEKYRNAS